MLGPPKQIPYYDLNPITEIACSGRGLFNSDGVTDCKRCDTCPNGKYAIDVGRCTGSGIWNDSFTCTDCLPCPSGYEHAAPCDGLTFNDTCKLCPSCPAGSYISSYWNATSKRMVCTCSPCTQGNCAANQYRTNVTCSGTKPFDEACASCTSCNAGEYILPGRSCTNGSGFVDASAGFCKPCRQTCPNGFYLTGSCETGLETQDRGCSPCTSVCPRGQYAFGRCDGTTTFDSRQCVSCGSCLPGQIQTAFCDGTSTVDTTGCMTCNSTACKPAYVLVNQCTGLGTVDKSTCVSCFPNNGAGCLRNQYVSRMCTAAACELAQLTENEKQACLKSASIYDGQCSDCKTSCLPPSTAAQATLSSATLPSAGQYILIPCSGTTNSDLVCANCRPGGCQPGEYVSSLCTSGSTSYDTTECKTCTCPSGSYAPNNTCTGNTTSNVLNCIQCTKATSCPAGQFLLGECSTFSSNPRLVLYS